MIQPLLALVLVTGQQPAPAELPPALAARELAAVVQATATHFAAQNLSTTPQLLVVGDQRGTVLASLPLRPGERQQRLLGRRGMDDLWFELVRLEGCPLLCSGAHSLGALRASADGTLWAWSHSIGRMAIIAKKTASRNGTSKTLAACIPKTITTIAAALINALLFLVPRSSTPTIIP